MEIYNTFFLYKVPLITYFRVYWPLTDGHFASIRLLLNFKIKTDTFADPLNVSYLEIIELLNKPKTKIYFITIFRLSFNLRVLTYFIGSWKLDFPLSRFTCFWFSIQILIATVKKANVFGILRAFFKRKGCGFKTHVKGFVFKYWNLLISV